MPRHEESPSLRPTNLPVRALCALALLAGIVANSSSAAAQAAQTPATASDDDERAPLLHVRADGHAGFDWEGGFGLGLRADIPILDRSRMYNSRDELAISVGGDVMFVSFGGSNQLHIWPTATVQWSLAVNDRFVFYPELGLTAKFERDGWDGMYPNIGFGGRYYTYKSVAVVGRLGWPVALSAGVAF